MGDHKDKMYTYFPTKDSLDMLVTSICKTEQLAEATVRDLLSHGWAYYENKWMKPTGTVVELR